MDFFMKNFFSKMIIFRGNFMREIDCAHSQNVKTLPWPWFRERIRIYVNKLILLQYTDFSLNQGQGNVFTFWECAQSISRIKLPIKVDLFRKNFFHEIVHNLYSYLSDFFQPFFHLRSHKKFSKSFKRKKGIYF